MDDYVRGRAAFYRGKALDEVWSLAMRQGFVDAHALHRRVAGSWF